MAIKLEAIVCSDKLRIFEVNGNKNYLGFAYFDKKDFTEQDMKNTAVLLYSRSARDLKKVPKIEVKIIY